MKAVKCDKCKKFYEPYLLYRHNKKNRLVKEELMPGAGANGLWLGNVTYSNATTCLDLCPDCLNQLLEWLSQV